MSVTVNGTNGLTFNDGSSQQTAASGFGFKNRIINGDMRIDQRNAGAAITFNGNTAYSVDRFQANAYGGGAFTAQQSSTAPAGFSNSLVLTVTTPDSSIAATDSYWISQIIEGYNVADFGWGSTSASTVTLSFWVRSSITGSFSGSLNNSAYDRSFLFSYTINSANTWEQKTVTILGDTAGTWLKTNGKGVYLIWDLGTGSTYSNSTAGSWIAGGYQKVTGSTNLIATNGATFYITGVQLEKGSTATSFDYRPYGTELALCQRYYQKSYTAGTVPGTTTFVGMEWTTIGGTISRIAGTTHFVQSMRDVPGIVPYDQTGTANRVRTSAGNGQTGYIIQTISTEKFVVDYTASITELIYHWTASAEL